MQSPKPSRRSKKNRKQRRPINVIASVLTTFSLYCGIASIFASINGEFDKASYWILAAIVLDTLDGTVARMTKSVSNFGKELDSLSDIISFGTAPAVLIYTAYLIDEKNTGSMIAIIYLICGALRLARYNVYQSERRRVFVGLPIPAGGGTLASFVLFTNYFEWHVTSWVLGPLTIGLSALMVSTIPYPRELSVFIIAPKHAFRMLTLCVVAIAVFHYARQYSPSIVLLPLGMSYVLSGLGNNVYEWFQRRRSTEEDGPLEEAETPLPGAAEADPDEPPPHSSGDAASKMGDAL